jgi:hypothetical protein
MATLTIVPSIDRSSSSARVAASASTASHPAFDVHPFATRQQRDGRIGKKPSMRLRSEHLFKAVLKAQRRRAFLRSFKLAAVR